MRRKQSWGYGVLCTVVGALVGCGGGGSSGGSAGAGTSLSGLAATGAGIANASVTAKCASGTPLSGTTDGNGSYTLVLDGRSLPCMVQVTGGTPSVTLHSFAQAAGRVNITPVTDLIVAKALGADPATAFTGYVAANGTTIETGLAAAKTYVSTQIGNITGGTIADPLTGAFAVGDADDKVLDALGNALTAANKSIGDLRTQAQNGATLTNTVPAHLAAPTGLTATASGSTAINLSWTAVAGATGYKIYRATGSGVVTTGVATATSSATSFSDSELSAATRYFYKVLATNSVVGAGTASSEQYADTQASSGGGSSGLTCDASKFAQGASVVAPSLQELASFVRTYTGSEGDYGPNPGDPFVASGSATLVFNSGGTATYNGASYAPTSYCLETLSGSAGTQLVIHSGAMSHFDLKANGAWSGYSVGNKVVKDTAYVPPVSSAISGATWTAANAVAGNSCRSFKAAVQGGDKWVAVGDSGCIRTSSNGVDWSAGAQPVTGSNLQDVTYANGRYVAVGTSGKSQTSVNGTDWTQSTQTTYPTTMYAVLWNGSKFLAVTEVSASPNFGYNLYSSTDGASWTAQKITTDASVGANSLRLTGIAANGNTLVAVGGATTNCVAWRSTDGGSNWTSVGSNTCGQTPNSHDGKFQLGSGIGEDSALSVAYGNGKFVAIGALGSWATSTDGVTWTTGAIDASGGIFVRPYKIYFDGSQFIVVGNQKRIYTSSNGQTWTTRNIDTTVAYNSANNFHGIAGNATGRLVVVGNLASDGIGFLTSVP